MRMHMCTLYGGLQGGRLGRAASRAVSTQPLTYPSKQWMRTPVSARMSLGLPSRKRRLIAAATSATVSLGSGGGGTSGEGGVSG